jgi:hypothetical protein
VKAMNELKEKSKELGKILSEIKTKEEELKLIKEEKETEEKRSVYTTNMKQLSLFIKDWIQIFNGGNVWRTKTLETEYYDYKYSESFGTSTIMVKSKEGITKRRFFLDWFRPELEIEISRNFKRGRRKDAGSGDYDFITKHLRRYESEEKQFGFLMLPTMRIKTFVDIEFDSNEWLTIKDGKIPHYLNIIKDDLEYHLDQKIAEIEKNGKYH